MSPSWPRASALSVRCRTNCARAVGVGTGGGEAGDNHGRRPLGAVRSAVAGTAAAAVRHHAGVRFGSQLLGDLDQAAAREWLVADGCGGFAMGTAAGLRTRRYHGLLVTAVGPLGVRRLGLAALDAVLWIGDRAVRLAVDEWRGGAVDPRGDRWLETFDRCDGVPRWRWTVGDICLERELAMVWGRSAVVVVHRLVRAPAPVRLELAALVTWRDSHGLRLQGGPSRGHPPLAADARGLTFEGRLRVEGPGVRADGGWYAGVRYREDAARGLADCEDLCHAGTFSCVLEPGASTTVAAWSPVADPPPPPGPMAIAATRRRARRVEHPAGEDVVGRQLLLAADQFVVEGPRVVAGYPWFGEWSRDTMTSYEGLFLATGRAEEGGRLLAAAAATLSRGMLANTTDPVGGESEGGDRDAPAYNTADATLWYVHAVGRHLAHIGDGDGAAPLVQAVLSVIDHHLGGTRFGIGVDPADGLLRQGAPGRALTWMDARVDGVAVTPRAGKAVELNALWVNALDTAADLCVRVGRDPAPLRARAAACRRAFRAAFIVPGGCRDVVDGDPAQAGQIRPNCLLAASLPHAPLLAGDPAARAIVARVGATLLTPLGVRSLDPADPAYRGTHRGSPAARDRAYHQGTVWPWLMGAYVDAAGRAGLPLAGLLAGLEQHLAEWGLGSVSETADGDPPHRATGCPFQAWSVAELIRARLRVGSQPASASGSAPRRADPQG